MKEIYVRKSKERASRIIENVHTKWFAPMYIIFQSFLLCDFLLFLWFFTISMISYNFFWAMTAYKGSPDFIEGDKSTALKGCNHLEDEWWR